MSVTRLKRKNRKDKSIASKRRALSFTAPNSLNTRAVSSKCRVTSDGSTTSPASTSSGRTTVARVGAARVHQRQRVRKAYQYPMSWGVAFRNAVAIGVGGIISMFSGYGRDNDLINLATESDDNLVQEDGGFIIV